MCAGSRCTVFNLMTLAIFHALLKLTHTDIYMQYSMFVSCRIHEEHFACAPAPDAQAAHGMHGHAVYSESNDGITAIGQWLSLSLMFIKIGALCFC